MVIYSWNCYCLSNQTTNIIRHTETVMTFNITIRNCNNIDFGEISIKKNKLNIKHGNNGTGKSTIAKAITLRVGKEQPLNDLLPFKLRTDNPHGDKPEVIGCENISSVMVFNDEYLSNFAFKPDEVLENSFDVFIKSPVYEEKLRAIEDIIRNVKDAFRSEEHLENLLHDLRELSGSFRLSQSGLSKASTGFKALASGNKCEHIPEGLEGYSAFLKNANNVQWIDWQQKGQSFIDISDDCPFCAFSTKDRKEHIVRVSKEYDKNNIKNLAAIILVIAKLGKYFSKDTRAKLTDITKMKEGLEPEHENFIADTKKQIDILIEKLENLKNISGGDFSEVKKVAEKLPGYKIELSFLNKLDSSATNEVITSLNARLERVIKQAGRLQGEVNQQRREVERLIKRNQESINNFLLNAGYKYEVELTPDGKESFRLRLKHVDCNSTISGGSQHLSFGEKNAFSLVLFMHECLAKKPNLIILDDPISSFDKNKKYAILDRLFRQDHSFKGMTTLMLTHDIEPIIDSVKTLYKSFSNISEASFLRADNGVISEQKITRNDIKTVSQLCVEIVKSNTNDMTKLVYLRRYFEVIDDKCSAYQILSNLMKGRADMEDHRLPKNQDDKHPLLEMNDINLGITEIQELMPDFEYNSLLKAIGDHSSLKELYRNVETSYEKLHIYRLIDAEHKNSVIRKYINECYHIENDYICQLDPSKFDLIPEYVIAECDKAIATIV